jgi:hypothetical protein
MRLLVIIFTTFLLIPAWSLCGTHGSLSSDDELPPYLRDRGPGISTSMFGTYVLPGELLVYPFFEYYLDHDAEYSPQELGFGLDRDFRGEYEAFEGLIFLGYGLTSDISVEMEAAVISADLDKSPEDPTDVPDEINESGLGDVQTQINWRWLRETGRRPALFSYFEVVYPLQKDKVLIGTSDWEFKLGTGVIRGFGWGTMTLRAAVEYDRSEDKFEIGEVAVEYLRRFSPLMRLYVGVEGTQDEVELIPELQLHVTNRMFIKLNSAVGLTSKATDWAPETGVVFRF